VLSDYGSFLHGIQEFDQARSILYQAISKHPDFSYKNYMLLGELLNSQQAIQSYEKGVELIACKIQVLKSKQAENSIWEDELDELQKELALGYCAQAEIYQTDLLELKTSESLCRQAILKALECDPLCLDAYLQFANFFLIKEDPENAKKMLLRIVEEIRTTENQDTVFEHSRETVPYPFRISVAKVLIEVEEFEQALYVLNGLFDDDSTFLDVNYMLAFVNFKLKNYYQVNELLAELHNQDFSADCELQTAYEELV